MDIGGKLAVVTGGTDGIGLAVARALKAGGAQVVVVGRDATRLAAAAAEGLEAMAGDLSSAPGVDALAAALAGRPVDLLINNAGMEAPYDVAQRIDLAAIDRAIYLNLNAPVRLTALLIDGLKARPRAMIVNVSSGLAIAPNTRSPVYCATKAALRSFTMSLRAQLKGSNVHVLEALPPVVETRMTAGNPHKKLPVAECARQIVAAIRADRAYANVGMTRVLDAVFNLSPPIARRIMLNY